MRRTRHPILRHDTSRRHLESNTSDDASAPFATLDQTVSALKGDVHGGSLERLAWISTERKSPKAVFAESAILGLIRSEDCALCYPIWCSDSLVAQHLLGAHHCDSLSFRAAASKVRAGRMAIRTPISLIRTSEFLSLMNPLVGSDVRRIWLRGNPG
jgi:hypothetical protein